MVGEIYSCRHTRSNDKSLRAWATCARACTPPRHASHALQRTPPRSSQPRLSVVEGTKQEHKLDLLQFTGGPF